MSNAHSNARGGQAPALRTKKRRPFIVGRGPVPRHATRAIQRSRGTGPRATNKKTPPFHVGLGPSDAPRACERVSLAMPHAQSNVRGGQAPALRCASRPGGLSYRIHQNMKPLILPHSRISISNSCQWTIFQSDCSRRKSNWQRASISRKSRCSPFSAVTSSDRTTEAFRACVTSA